MNLTLNKPLVVFDLETTGINTSKDRIVELYMIRIEPDGKRTDLLQRFNPEVPIPAEVSAIHGIYDADVQNEPTFKVKAGELNKFLENCDFAGFNSNKFDFPMLVEEFYRAGVDFDISKRKFIDAQKIFHTMEPRNLSAAFRFYCNKELEQAHSAKADTEATWEIIQAQLERYKDKLEPNIEFLHKFSGQSNLADLAGRLIYNDKNEILFNFGKHRGKRVEDVFKTDFGYYDWMMQGDFPQQTKKSAYQDQTEFEKQLKSMAKALKLKDIKVYEDEHVIAVNKPAHLSSLHERFESNFESVIELCKRENENYSLCHRLDRETSGIMLIAKNNEAYRHIAMQFEKRSIKKVYHALVGASVDLHELKVDLPLYTDSKRRVQISRNKGKDSLTVFNTLEKFKHHSLLSCEPLSGRLHQIRVHAASQNLPLLSDELYGGKKVFLSDFKRKTNIGTEPEKPIIDRVALHAFSIEFESPDKGRMQLSAPYPKDFEVALKLLSKYDSFD